MIASHTSKWREVTFDNKNNVFCRASNGEYFEKKDVIRQDEKRMSYRQNTKGTVLYVSPVITFMLRYDGEVLIGNIGGTKWITFDAIITVRSWKKLHDLGLMM